MPVLCPIKFSTLIGLTPASSHLVLKYLRSEWHVANSWRFLPSSKSFLKPCAQSARSISRFTPTDDNFFGIVTTPVVCIFLLIAASVSQRSRMTQLSDDIFSPHCFLNFIHVSTSRYASGVMKVTYESGVPA